MGIILFFTAWYLIGFIFTIVWAKKTEGSVCFFDLFIAITIGGICGPFWVVSVLIPSLIDYLIKKYPNFWFKDLF